MLSKLEQAIERLSAVVGKLEVTSHEASSSEKPSGSSADMTAEIVKIRGLVDDAMALIAKNDKRAG